MNEPLHAKVDIVRGFPGLRALVIGDAMLDTYLEGTATRLCKEGPVPVVRRMATGRTPGGAANVAANVAALGADCRLVAVVGQDERATSIRDELEDLRLSAEYLVVDAGRPTTSKTRVVARGQQMLRIDEEIEDPVSARVMEQLAQALERAMRDADALLIEDYNKGTLVPQVIERALALARKRSLPVVVDPKFKNFFAYRGATVFKPNRRELELAMGAALDLAHPDALPDALGKLAVDNLLLTLGGEGMMLVTKDHEITRIPTMAREVFDVSGAGDTVIATLSASIAAGLSIETSVELANLAAGIVVGKVGTVPIAHHELITALTPSSNLSAAEKILDHDALGARIADWRASGETIVFTNGCFDLLHVGHVTLLEDSRRFGSKLVLGLNSDASVCRLKGPTRPVVGERERARVMAALAAVDAVVLFEEDTPLELIRAIHPDVLVKGGDYTIETVVGHEEVLASGGRVEIVPTVEGFSTTNIVRKLTAQEIPATT